MRQASTKRLALQCALKRDAVPVDRTYRVGAGPSVPELTTLVASSESEGWCVLRRRHRHKLGQTVRIQDLDPAASFAFHETGLFELTQGSIHHHPARPDHGREVGSLRDRMGGVEDR